jgi:PEGA domain
VTVDLQAGTHTIRVTRDGYEPFTKEVFVKSGETTLVRVFLKKIIEDVP